MNILDLCWCTVYNGWMRRRKPYDWWAEDKVESFLPISFCLYTITIIILICVVLGVRPSIYFGIIPPLLCYFVMLFVSVKRYKDESFRKELLNRFEQYKKEHPVLRLVRFWAFVLGPFVLLFLCVVVS